MDPLEQARRLFMTALDHQQAHRLVEAEAAYRMASSLAPERVSILVNLGAVLISQHRFSEAREYCHRVLAIEPGHIEAQQNLALCLSQNDTLQASLDALDEAIRATPDQPALHSNRGALLREVGRQAEALASFDRALQLAPDLPGVLSNRASLLTALKRPSEAMLDYLRALRTDPAFPAAGQGFAELALTQTLPASLSETEHDSLLVRAISVPWSRPQAMAPLLLQRLQRTTDYIDALTAASRADSTGESIDLGRISSLLSNPVLLALIENALVTDLALEQVLTQLRSALLDSAELADASMTPPAPLLRVHCALARQCHLNEYVFALSEAEEARAAALAERLRRGLDRSAPLPASWVAAVACYGPLHRWPGNERLTSRAWPTELDVLLEQQIRQPRLERELSARIPALNASDRNGSTSTRLQDDENPYPRWTALPPTAGRESLASYHARRVPGATAAPVPTRDRIETLVVECGTGQHPIELALRIDALHILAVDARSACLAYAQRKARQHGVRNVEFAHADMRELQALGRRFALIDATGAFRLRADTTSLLAVLAALLDGDGLLRFSLHSESARRHIVAARELIAQPGRLATLTGVRAARAQLIALEPADSRRRILTHAEFYSASQCRDLLFPTQEAVHRLPAIGEMLQRCGLHLLGLEVDADLQARFRARFPASEALADLRCWDTFEREHPDTFSSMYTLWARRANTSTATPVESARSDQRAKQDPLLY